MIRRGLVLAALAGSLAMQPPVESSLGTQPTPPVVGLSGGTGPEAAPVSETPDPSLVRYAITQGGLALVLLAVLWSYRRDFTRLLASRDDDAAKDREDAAEDRRALIGLVEKNTTALVSSEATNARLARAVEAHKLVPPGSAA